MTRINEVVMKCKVIINQNKNPIYIGMIWFAIAFLGGLKLIYDNYGHITSLGTSISFFGKLLALLVAVLLAFLSIISLCVFIYRALTFDGKERKIVIYATPFLVLLVSKLIVNLQWTSVAGYFVGDEKLIWDSAVKLYPFCFVYTSELFLVSFFVFPITLAPTILKIILYSFLFGYIIYRINKYYSGNYGFVVYMFCIFEPFINYGLSVHRMFWYAPLYLFFTVKIYFDNKERKKKSFALGTVVYMSLISALLTVWRREGFYLLVVGFIIIWIVYCKNKSSYNIKHVMILYYFCTALLLIPLLSVGAAEKSVTIRSYLVRMMYESSFNEEVVKDELDVIDKYMNVEKIKKYNEENGIEGFADCFYDWQGWKDGKYYVARNNYTDVNEEEFNKAVLSIIIKEPIVFLKSRIRSFLVVSCVGYGYGFGGNMMIPFLFLFVILVYSLLKKDKILLLLSLGVFSHTVITIGTMPASYYKYFLEMVMYAYAFFVIINIDYLNKRQGDCIN